MSPLIYTSFYSLLRKLFLKKYKMEPTYNRSSWYDFEEKRNQKWSDLGVFLIPVIASLAIPLLIELI